MYLKLFLLADLASIDAAGKLNIIGIFDSVGGSSFPVRHRDLTLVAAIEAQPSSKGVHKISIEFRDEKDNRKLNIEQDLDFGLAVGKDGMIRARVLLKIQDLIIEKPGQYQFVLFCDGRFLGRVFLTAALTSPKSN